MAVAFTPGQELVRGDLDIFLQNSSGNPANAATITYALYYVDPNTLMEVLIGSATRTPVNPAIGEYYAAVQIPANATEGDYRIRWTFQELVTSPQQQVVQEFAVVSAGSVLNPGFSAIEQDLIDCLRIMLRDNNPDRNYHFRPPEHEGTIGAFNQVFGYIWEDEELLHYLKLGLDFWNSAPPETEELCSLELLIAKKPMWRMAVLWGAMIFALQALMINWISEEFDYSIGGISLSIERSSKYEAAKRNAEEMFSKMADEWKTRTTKIVMGLRQPRFNTGVRSSFGPFVSRGTLSPRKYMGF